MHGWRKELGIKGEVQVRAISQAEVLPGMVHRRQGQGRQEGGQLTSHLARWCSSSNRCSENKL